MISFKIYAMLVALVAARRIWLVCQCPGGFQRAIWGLVFPSAYRRELLQKGATWQAAELRRLSITLVVGGILAGVLGFILSFFSGVSR